MEALGGVQMPRFVGEAPFARPGRLDPNHIRNMPFQQLLKRHFGYETFRGRQRDVIEHVVGGKHALVIMPTGSGKSICFQIPAIHLAQHPGCDHSAGNRALTLVISPLIALMKDQVDTLTAKGIAATFINSSLTRQQRELEVQIENLTARQRMVEVAKTASQIEIDDSQLARTRKMIDDISARIDTEEEMLSLDLDVIFISADSPGGDCAAAKNADSPPAL